MKKKIILVFMSVFLLFLVACDTLIGAVTSTTVKITGPEKITVGESVQLTAAITPDAYAKGGVLWHSNNSEVASITTDGVLTGVKSGRVSITATAVDDDKAIGKLYIKVVEEEIVYTDEAPTSIEVIGPSVVYNGSITTYRIKTTPANASQEVEWTLPYMDAISINNNGVLSVPKNITGAGFWIQVTSKKDPNVTVRFDVSVTERKRNDSSEQAIIDVIANTKDSILGVANYAYNKNSVLVKTSLGSGFVYFAYGILNDGTKVYNDLETNNDIVKYGYYLITNHHVVDKSDSLKIYLHSIDEEIDATLIQYDNKVDLAVVEFTYDEYIKPLTFANSNEIQAGEFCIAIGNPEGFEFSSSATLGIISYPLRYVSDDTDNDGTNDWDAAYIQHDAPINPGNSGGPLLNLYGQVIGINTMKFASEEIDNMGFSIPANDVIELLPYLEKGKIPTRARIGVTVIAVRDLLQGDYQNADYNYIIPDGQKTGIYITEVSEGSVAYGVLKADDIMLEFNGVVLKNSLQLRAELGAIVVGSNTTIRVLILRNGEEMTVELTW